MTGAERILAERQRQIAAEGWIAEHDDQWTRGQLAEAANCYLRPFLALDLWPWDAEWWKPSGDHVRNLEKAGALIAAEIDRLLRLAAGKAVEG